MLMVPRRVVDRLRRVGLTLTSTLFLTSQATLHTQKASISEATIRAHMEFLASDAMKGRGSGTEDEWRAAEYIGSQLRRLGVEPLGDNGGFVQRIATGRSRVTTPPVLSFGDREFTHGREIVAQTLGAGSATGPLAKYGTDGQRSSAAFLLLPEGVTPDPSMSTATAILMPQTPQIRASWLARAATPLVTPTPSGGRLPPARLFLNPDAYATVAALANGTTLSFTAALQPQYTWNALGQLRGSNADTATDVILLSAHLDHLGVRGTGPDTIFNGADDDASGTTAVLVLAEALAAGKRLKRTVMFVWFGSEEAGGVGARHFLEAPPVALDRIVANIEFEMIGRPDSIVAPHTLWITGYDRSNLGPELAKHGARVVADPHPEQRFFTRSDNIQLACEGVVAQTISSFGLHKEYHTAADDLAHIDFAHMTEAIASMLAPVLWISNATFKPAWRSGQKPVAGNPCPTKRVEVGG